MNEALRINPQYGNAYSNRGFSHQGKCLYDLAMADFSEAIRLRPQLADPYYGRGICYQEHERDYARALSDYDMALSITGEFKLALKDRQNAEDRRQQALDALNNSAQ